MAIKKDLKKGDKVRLIGVRDCYGLVRGDEGTLQEDNDTAPFILWDRIGRTFAVSEDDIELFETKWVPKVGDRVRFKTENPSYGAKYSANGLTVKAIEDLNKDGSVNVSVSYDDEAVNYDQYCTSFDIEPLLAAAEPSEFSIEAGKFYRTRDGRKIGPILKGEQWPQGPWFFKFADNHFFKDGKSCYGGNGNANRPGDDLIAEWVDEPVVAASNDNDGPTLGDILAAAMTPKFKVGDLVRSLIDDIDVTKGHEYEVLEVYKDGGVRIIDDAGDFWTLELRNVELVNPTTPALTNPAIVCLIENGQPKPSDRPYVHADEGAASTEASRLASVHKGKQFGVYVLTQTVIEEKVYAHEWQRLAIKGDKIPAIKALKAANDLTLKGAKDAVEHWLATAA